MSRPASSQASFFDPEFADPHCLDPGSVPWLLGKLGSEVFPRWLFDEWKVPGRQGPKGWPASVLLTLLLLRWNEEGLSMRAAVRRARRDTSWRAAMRLPIGGETPSLRTLRRFESFLRKRHEETATPRYLLLHEHFVRLCLDAGVVRDSPVWAMDSTPMWAYGAGLDTIRLMGDGLRSLARAWSGLQRKSLADIAAAWHLPMLLAPSTKGAHRVDWRDAGAKSSVVDGLAHDVLRIVADVRAAVATLPSRKRKAVLRRCRNLLKVVHNDLETDEDGRLVVAKKVARDRLVSITDPQARHSRKSRSKVFKGFKIHLLGDAASGLLLSVAVTPANVHDNVPAHRLIRRAKALRADIDRVLGDTAYSAAWLRHLVFRSANVHIVAPPIRLQARPGKLGREDFEFDLENSVGTCPAGFTNSEMGWTYTSTYQTHVRWFRWAAARCASCPLRQACNGQQQRGHRVLLHPYQAELTAARDAWKQPEVREFYRARSQCERLIRQVTRHGGRQCRAWGLGAANLQAHQIAMRCNLALLAKALAKRQEIEQAQAA